MSNKNYDYLFKFLLLGEENVGKTQLISRYVENEFHEEYISTIGNQNN